MYTAALGNGVIRVSDSKFIANNPGDPEWDEFVTWQVGGGVLSAYVPPPPVYEWYIDIGPFFDRFGAAKMNVLSSTHPVARAVVTDTMVRKWIDLKNPNVALGIDALIAIGITGVDAALKTAIIDTPVTEEERGALLKTYF